MNTRTSIFIIGVVIVGLFSCKKDTEEQATPTATVDNTFPVRFIFVNKSGQPLKGVVLRSYFYNTTENITHLNDAAYSIDYTGRNLYKDSIMHIEYKGVVGCRKGFEVEFMFFNDKGMVTRQCRFANTQNEYGDTIKKPADGIENFHWPMDTLRYFKTYDWHNPADTL